MDCEEALSLISAEVDGENDAAARAALESHLSVCAACREALGSLRQQDADLRRAFAPRREAARAVAERTVERLRRPRGFGLGRLPWLPMVLSAAAGFLLALIIFYPPKPAGEPVGPPEVAARPGPAPAPAPPAAPDTPARPTVELAWAKGAIEMLRPGRSSWEAVVSGGNVEVGSRVRTGKKVLCEFRTPEGSEVRLNGDSELVFHAARDLELVRGQVFSSVAEAQDPYRVHVPREEASVTALGTQFDVDLRTDHALLTVVQGVTRVEGPGGEEIGTFKVRDRARIVKGRIDRRNVVEDLAVATGWINEILALKKGDDRELAKRRDELFALIGRTKMNHLVVKEIVALGDHCVLPLIKFIQSELSQNEKHRRIEAAQILEQIAQPWACGELIELLADEDPTVRYWAAMAIRRVTGGALQGLGPESWRDLPREAREKTLQAWRAWWEENKDDFPGGP